MLLSSHSLGSNVAKIYPDNVAAVANILDEENR